jgi:hypothetical protein
MIWRSRRDCAGLLGNAYLLIATYGKIGMQSNCIALVQVTRAVSGEAITTPTIQGV